jgi:CHAT domain-containing protein
LGLAPAKFKLAADFEASRETVLSTDFAAFQAIHFAAHGVMDEETPELSGIVLSTVDINGRTKEGAVRLHDLYAMKLPVDLAVLSACETALGKTMRGEGIVGLTRGMMYAGASRVISTLWKVDDAASAELMRAFYKAYFAGSPAPAALQSAQAELRRNARWKDPYFWAGFQLSGEYR